MLTTEQKQQFSNILEELGKSLDITEEQHKKAVKSYEFVGNWLAADDSLLARYKPEILPQGSFMLGTMIKPVVEDDELDIDLVCRLEGKQPYWTQYDLKQKVGDRLKEHGTIKDLLKIPDGRRCWTLDYKGDFHMDVLPSIVSSGYRMVLEKAFASTGWADFSSLEIRITDKKRKDYRTETLPERWLKSNPFGYGIWFAQKASLSLEKRVLLSKAVQPVPAYQKEKLPLQRVVQILKRHRDMWADGDEHKPISIIITTLAGKAYRKETSIIEALINVVNSMENYIEDRYVPELGKTIKWIANPVNEEENFADKWVEVPQKQTNFYKWLEQVKADINKMTQRRGLQMIQESLEKPFGENVVRKAFSTYGDNLLKQRESGTLKMAAGTGILGSTGRTSVPQHKPFGKNE
ncbi:MAG: nucleotidyltransferase [Bacteroidetes bacterium]|nr:MAG: nucleotidyltransferase [Bacteroidota bacterium]